MKNKKLMLLTAILLLLLSACNAKRTERIPNTGDEPFVLGDYLLEKDGFAVLINELRCYMDMPEGLRVSYFSAELDRHGYMQSFTLSLIGYDEQLKFVADYRFSYVKSNAYENDLQISVPDDNPPMILEYNENADPDYLDTQLKQIKLADQIKLLDFPKYEIKYNGSQMLETGQPIIDGTSEGALPLLTLKEYYNGEGGVSDGSTGVYFCLGDGVGYGSENNMYFRFPAANPETIIGNRDLNNEFDHKVFDGAFYFTRDYGETWIEAKLPEGALEETLELYGRTQSVPEGSFSITEQPGVLALLYGRYPTLLLSNDDGQSWRSIDLDAVLGSPEYPHMCTRRIVRFFDEDNGYVALGTDYSMGAGEFRILMLTQDGGETWEQKDLPLSGTSQVLSGLCFADAKQGIVSLKHIYNYEDSPALYYTEDRGDTWTELAIAWEELPNGYEYITRIDSLVYDNNQFTMVLSQDEKKVSFVSDSLAGQWHCEDDWQGKK